MVEYLLDTDWCVSFLNGRREATELVDELAPPGLAISLITWGELFEGLLGDLPQSRRRVAFDTFVASVDLLVPDVVVARRYAEIRADLRARGLLIPDNDLWIAATALAHDLVLISRDLHFARVAGLTRYGAS